MLQPQNFKHDAVQICSASEHTLMLQQLLHSAPQH
jgi:hypothetical protein